MEELQYKIKKIEEKYLVNLSRYCQSVFLNTRIPSHDHSHHVRVWEFSKEILFALAKNYTINSSLIESCLIASMFHDTGLIINIGLDHGIESRKICQDYFNNMNVSEPNNFENILTAIEKHDDKDYKQSDNNPSTLLSILCNADDLDAFGKVGVLRYTEIYLLRGISLNDLPDLVINNLNKRFMNFENTFKSFPDLYEKHKLRYLETRKFFEEIQNEL